MSEDQSGGDAVFRLHKPLPPVAIGVDFDTTESLK